MGSSPVPTIDIAPLVEGGFDALGAPAVIEALGSACAEVGFLAVTGHGVSPALLKANRMAARRFFALSSEAKLRVAPRRWNPESANVYRGYFPSSVHGKEGFDIGDPGLDASMPELLERPYYERNRLPVELGAAWSDTVFTYYDELLRLGRTLLEALARFLGGSLGAETRSFERPHSLSTLRFNLYPAREAPVEIARDDGAGLSCAAHVDSGLVTVLYQADPDARAGLQVRAADRGWVDVPRDAAAFVVNTGLAFETLSKGTFRATRHRVLHSGSERLSIPFFVEPAHDFPVAPRSLGLDEEQPLHAMDYETFLAKALEEFPEYSRDP